MRRCTRCGNYFKGRGCTCPPKPWSGRTATQSLPPAKHGEVEDRYDDNSGPDDVAKDWNGVPEGLDITLRRTKDN